jgi:hypothetical protein
MNNEIGVKIAKRMYSVSPAIEQSSLVRNQEGSYEPGMFTTISS